MKRLLEIIILILAVIGAFFNRGATIDYGLDSQLIVKIPESIADLEYSRWTHEEAIEYIHRIETKPEIHQEYIEWHGDIPHHEKWIIRYNYMIDILTRYLDLFEDLQRGKTHVLQQLREYTPEGFGSLEIYVKACLNYLEVDINTHREIMKTGKMVEHHQACIEKFSKAQDLIQEFYDFGVKHIFL